MTYSDHTVFQFNAQLVAKEYYIGRFIVKLSDLVPDAKQRDVMNSHVDNLAKAIEVENLSHCNPMIAFTHKPLDPERRAQLIALLAATKRTYQPVPYERMSDEELLQLVDGLHRYLAAMRLGLKQWPVDLYDSGMFLFYIVFFANLNVFLAFAEVHLAAYTEFVMQFNLEKKQARATWINDWAHIKVLRSEIKAPVNKDVVPRTRNDMITAVTQTRPDSEKKLLKAVLSSDR